MSDLNGFSDEDLKRELEKRKKAKKALKNQKQKFVLNDNPDLSDIKKFAEEEKDNWIERGNCSSDAETFMYEKVMRMFYGNDFFYIVRKMHK
mgnify:CR=1 FL=1